MARSATPPPLHGTPGSRSIVDGIGVVAFGPSGRLERVWTRYGLDAPNPWLNAPVPDVTYVAGANVGQRAQGVRLRHIYRTGHDGLTTSAEAQCVRAYPRTRAGRRWGKSRCSPVEFPGGGFDRGHLIAAQFGAGMESINLVSMPSSVNRLHSAATALRRGLSAIAALADRYRDELHHSLGTLTQSGEFARPSYRAFERVLTQQIKRGLEEGYGVSVRIEPSTFRTGAGYSTGILHTQITVGGKAIYRYKIDCDVQ